MRKTIQRIAVLTATGALLCAQPAAAEGPVKEKVAAAKEKRGEAREKTKEARDKIKEAVKATGTEGAEAAKEAAKEARGEAKEARKEAKEATGEAKDAIKEGWKKMRETRKERREERRAKIKEKWGEETLKHPAARVELTLHARRVARLNRIRSLAKEAEKDAVAERVDKLLAKENSRHEKRMATLKAKDGGAE